MYLLSFILNSINRSRRAIIMSHLLSAAKPEILPRNSYKNLKSYILIRKPASFIILDYTITSNTVKNMDIWGMNSKNEVISTVPLLFSSYLFFSKAL
jgi:hypothetical protein